MKMSDDTDGSQDKSSLSKRKQQMVDALTQAKKELGRSPSTRDFNDLDLEKSADEIAEAFGTWNDAKRAAGLKTYDVGEGRRAHTNINEKYFADIDTPEKSYWLGTIIATSSIRTDPRRSLVLGRSSDKEYFVKQFAKAIESDYKIHHRENDDVQMTINNDTFINNLISAGYPGPNQTKTDFPDLKESLRKTFIRGYLESAGYFSVKGWAVPVNNKQSAKRLKGWFSDFGANRPTTGNRGDTTVVRVSNAIDIKDVFETCWPEGLSTCPSFTPYPKKILEHLDSKYPRPENVDYLGE
jgi:hypothetical protein